MKVDTSLLNGMATAGADAAAAEAAGYSALWTLEGQHDPFLPLVLAAEHTERIQLGTAIAVAFARNPMLLANIGWDLQAYSKGRFILGLGSQIKPHITKRFSMPWSSPAARMRDMVLATRAIWDAWLTGGRLAYRGEFYTHTLMTPFFNPAPAELDGFGPPQVFLAGVGELMTEVAGEVGDGFLCHPLTSERYLREVILPALARGRAKAGKTMDGFDVVGPNFVVTGADEQAMAAAAAGTRRQIAFYGSTPAYRPVLELHGWGALGEELNTLSKRGDWVAMGDLIDDEVLETIAVVAEPDQVASRLLDRYGDVVGRINLYDSYRTDPALRLALLEALAAG
jgi:probable F420-dependent oxidoreductase